MPRQSGCLRLAEGLPSAFSTSRGLDLKSRSGQDLGRAAPHPEGQHAFGSHASLTSSLSLNWTTHCRFPDFSARPSMKTALDPGGGFDEREKACYSAALPSTSTTGR